MKAAYRLVLGIGFCWWVSWAWAQPASVEFLDGNNQHANDSGRGYVDLVFQTRNLPLGWSFVQYDCSMQLNPFPNSGAMPILCEAEPVAFPAPVWESCDKGIRGEGAYNELIEETNINQRRTWRIRSPEGRYTFQVQAIFRDSSGTPQSVLSAPRTLFLDMQTNLPRIKGPIDRRLSNCTDVRIPVRMESQPRVWYTREGKFIEGEGEHSIGSPCYPHKVEFHVPLFLRDFHANALNPPVEQPGWNIAPGQTIYEKMRIQDIWEHPMSAELEFSITCDTTTPPVLRFLNEPPSDSPLPVAVFEFESDIADATFQCSLNDATFKNCTSPHLANDLRENTTHSFRVRAVNAAGVIGAPQTQTWRRTSRTGELGPVSIDNPRDSLGVQHSSLAAVEGQAPPGARLLVLVPIPAGGGFVAKCHLVADATGRWRCPISKILYNGDYTAQVYAWNENRLSSTSAAFAVREEIRPGSIGGKKMPPIVSSGGEEEIVFELSWPNVDLNNYPGSLQCRVDGDPYGSCGSPLPLPALNTLRYVVSTPPSSPGLHHFQVRVVDAAISENVQNATPLEYTWAILGDTQAFKPSVWMPPAKDGNTYLGGTTLVLRGKAEPFFPLSIYLNGLSEPVCERVEVMPDGTWECNVVDVAEGEHEVTAWVDILEKDAAQRHWTSQKFTFLRGNPKTFITRRPYKQDQNSLAVFEFASPRRQVSFECRVDEGAFEHCNSPFRIYSLTQGAHRFQVRAVDFADQRELVPATWNWTVGEVASSGCSCSATVFSPEGFWGLLAFGLLLRRRRK